MTGGASGSASGGLHGRASWGLSQAAVVRIGRLVKRLTRLRGGGTALPGLVVERLDPHFLARVLGPLAGGVIVVSGTNGKTTTTKMVVELLRASGLAVVTNRSGSNFTRGIVAGLLDELDPEGRLLVDVAVLELDEAHAVKFVEQMTPAYSLLLNVSRDQLDRFGEIDYTARLLENVARATSTGVVLNRDDVLVGRIAHHLPPAVEVRYFGLGAGLRADFPGDDHLYGGGSGDGASPEPRTVDVLLAGLDESTATFAFGDVLQAPVELQTYGRYNALNAAAALSLVRMVLGERADDGVLMRALGALRPAFGRGESIDVGGSELEIVLVKNPVGFRLALASYARREAATMIAINDSYADGRDVSWLWDVDFTELSQVELVSGSRAFDMALRLQYDDVAVGRVEPALKSALEELLRSPGPKRIFCTYTAMMKLRHLLEPRFDLVSID